MYNTKVVCTYNTSEIFLEDDKITDDERAFIRNAIYRQEFLDIFGIEDLENSREMESKIIELYNKAIKNTFLKECMIKLAGQFLNNNLDLGLMIMFSYDYMYLTHICISELLDTGIISETNMSNLRSIIF